MDVILLTVEFGSHKIRSSRVLYSVIVKVRSFLDMLISCFTKHFMIFHNISSVYLPTVKC